MTQKPFLALEKHSSTLIKVLPFADYIQKPTIRGFAQRSRPESFSRPHTINHIVGHANGELRVIRVPNRIISVIRDLGHRTDLWHPHGNTMVRIDVDTKKLGWHEFKDHRIEVVTDQPNPLLGTPKEDLVREYDAVTANYGSRVDHAYRSMTSHIDDAVLLYFAPTDVDSLTTEQEQRDNNRMLLII